MSEYRGGVKLVSGVVGVVSDDVDAGCGGLKADMMT